MRLHGCLRALAALSVILPSLAAAQVTPPADWRTPPRRFIIVAPATAFPDPVAVSMAWNPRANFTWEAGVAAVAPGAFVRAGVYLPFKVSGQDGSDLLVYAGYRGLAIPLPGAAVYGPTAGIGIRSWPRRGGWGWQVNSGLWFTNARVRCTGDCSGPNRVILPEVRIAGIRAR